MNDMTSDASYRVTAEELRQFVERFERLEAEKKDIADQQKEVMAEAKGRGYDTKVMRKLITLRKRDQDDIAEEEASASSDSASDENLFNLPFISSPFIQKRVHARRGIKH